MRRSDTANARVDKAASEYIARNSADPPRNSQSSRVLARSAGGDSEPTITVQGFAVNSSSNVKPEEESADVAGRYEMSGPMGTRGRDARGLNQDHVNLLKAQGFSTGLAIALAKNALLYDHRIWVVDNSGSMQISDGHRVVVSGDEYRIVESTRWEEIQDTVKYHAQMAALLDSPTIFKLLNNPGMSVGPQQFSVAENGDANSAEDINLAMKVMSRARPGGVTPLTRHINDIKKAVQQMSPQLLKEGKKVAVVLATDGLPTDEQGYGGEMANEEFVRALRSLDGLPVWIVVRLCTDQDSVTDFYNGLDAQLELSLEVLDDFLGEATEVAKCNSWLNYALPIHRSRELGYHDRLFDLIDERRLTVDEMREFCSFLFGKTLPDPSIDFEGFARAVVDALEEERFQWNPIKRKMLPWVNMKKLKKSYGSGKDCSLM